VPSTQPEHPVLPRALGLPLLVLYGLGVIIGAGIYVLIGTVVAQAGMAAPLAFMLAGAVAALTGLSYAELSARFPEAAGAPVYVRHGFGSERLSQVAGLAVGAIIAVSTATIARGSAGYAQSFLTLPDAVFAAIVVIAFTAVACLPVRQSVGVAAAITVVEVGGLLFLVAVGAPALAELPTRAHEMMPAGIAGWIGVSVGGFLAFFAFIGFENFANMAEEAKDPARNLPRAILLSIGLSTAAYIAVAVVAVLSVPVERLAAAPAPLMLVIRGAAPLAEWIFLPIALFAIANGVLIELLVLARLLFGMARRGWLPAPLATISPARETPIRATLVGGAVVLALTVLLDVAALARVTSAITLLVFALVNAALWRLHRTTPRGGAIRIPRWVPPVATVANLVLAAMSLVQ
jgi:APA family basic amino acid/polyamine antiporter